MLIPRFPKILKMQEQIWVLLGWHFYVVQLEVCSWKKNYKKGLIGLLNMCNKERLKYTTNKYVDCRTPGVFYLYTATSEP